MSFGKERKILHVHVESDIGSAEVVRYITFEDGSMIMNYIDHGAEIEKWIELSEGIPRIIIPGAQ